MNVELEEIFIEEQYKDTPKIVHGTNMNEILDKIKLWFNDYFVMQWYDGQEDLNGLLTEYNLPDNFITVEYNHECSVHTINDIETLIKLHKLSSDYATFGRQWEYNFSLK